MNPRNGSETARAVRSGPAIAMFFGTISPITMCRNTTMVRAMVRAIGCRTFSGICRNPRPSCRMPATAGSATKPRSSEAMVMPN